MKHHARFATRVAILTLLLASVVAATQDDKERKTLDGVWQGYKFGVGQFLMILKRQNPEPPQATPESLKAEIESLRPAKLAWREIAWNPCLLDGLKESREQRKPVLLWIFIDRPADDARC